MGLSVGVEEREKMNWECQLWPWGRNTAGSLSLSSLFPMTYSVFLSHNQPGAKRHGSLEMQLAGLSSSHSYSHLTSTIQKQAKKEARKGSQCKQNQEEPRLLSKSYNWWAKGKGFTHPSYINSLLVLEHLEYGNKISRISNFFLLFT